MSVRNRFLLAEMQTEGTPLPNPSASARNITVVFSPIAQRKRIIGYFASLLFRLFCFGIIFLLNKTCSNCRSLIGSHTSPVAAVGGHYVADMTGGVQSHVWH